MDNWESPHLRETIHTGNVEMWSHTEKDVKKVLYIDSDGRKSLVLLPNNAPNSDALMGVEVGPPSLAALKLPKATEIKLHNELEARGLYTLGDVKRHRQDVIGALMAAFKVDAEAIVSCYTINEGKETT